MVTKNIAIPFDLHKQIKIKAASEGKEMKEIVIQALLKAVK